MAMCVFPQHKKFCEPEMAEKAEPVQGRNKKAVSPFTKSQSSLAPFVPAIELAVRI
jgi:hypothetical protein